MAGGDDGENISGIHMLTHMGQALFSRFDPPGLAWLHAAGGVRVRDHLTDDLNRARRVGFGANHRPDRKQVLGILGHENRPARQAARGVPRHRGRHRPVPVVGSSVGERDAANDDADQDGSRA